MKIKELSSLTGVSDRTIRYYIDDGLFIPEKASENYTGRKSYDFTENDVSQLKQIALLRKYGFTIKDIKLLKQGQIDISDVLERGIVESKENMDEQSDNILALGNALEKHPSNLDELCELLSNPIMEQTPIPNIDEQSAYIPMYKRVKKRNKKLSIIVAVLILLLIIGFVKAQKEIGIAKIQKETVFKETKMPSDWITTPTVIQGSMSIVYTLDDYAQTMKENKYNYEEYVYEYKTYCIYKNSSNVYIVSVFCDLDHDGSLIFCGSGIIGSSINNPNDFSIIEKGKTFGDVLLVAQSANIFNYDSNYYSYHYCNGDEIIKIEYNRKKTVIDKTTYNDGYKIVSAFLSWKEDSE